MKHRVFMALGLLILASTGLRADPPKVSDPDYSSREKRFQASAGGRSRPGSGPVVPGSAFAGGAWVRIIQAPGIAEQLGLEEEQAATIRENLQETRDRMIDLRAALEVAAEQQAELMRREPIDEAAVMAMIEELGAIRTRIDQLRIREIIFLRQVLTDEQRARAQELMRTRFREQMRGSRATEEDNMLNDRPERRRKP